VCIVYGNNIELLECIAYLGGGEFKLRGEFIHRGDVGSGPGTRC
jgi:hypothetical protein